MTVHWGTMPKTLGQTERKPRKLTPFHADLAAINRVFQAAGLDTRAGFYGPRREKLIHWMGTPKSGQMVIYVLNRPPGEKISKIAGLLDEMAEEMTRTRGADCVPRLRLRPLALEVPHWRPAPLAWVDPDVLQPGQGRLGRTFDTKGDRDVVADLDQWPHVLMAGRTGAGKSVLLNGFLGALCLASHPGQLRLHLIDPKNEDLAALAGLPHVERCVYKADQVDQVLAWFSAELDRRVDAGRADWVRHVLVIDELASLLQQLPAIEDILKRAAQMGRSKRLHIIAATQRPDASILGGLLRSQFSARCVGSMASVQDANMAAGVTGSGAERIPVRSGRFVLAADGDLVTFQAYYYGATPAALVRAVRQRWSGAELPAPTVQAGPDYGSDEIGRVAVAIADLVEGYRADQVSLSELIRVAHAAGALQSKTPHKGPRNRGVIHDALARLGVGDMPDRAGVADD